MRTILLAVALLAVSGGLAAQPQSFERGAVDLRLREFSYGPDRFDFTQGRVRYPEALAFPEVRRPGPSPKLPVDAELLGRLKTPPKRGGGITHKPAPEGPYGGHDGGGTGPGSSPPQGSTGGGRSIATWETNATPCSEVSEKIAVEFDVANSGDELLPKTARQFEPQYRLHCFSKRPPKSVSTTEVSGAVGVFRLDNDTFCTGFLIAEAVVQTARHCFFNKKTGSPERARFLDRIRFHLLGDLNGSGSALAADQMRDRPSPGVAFIADPDDRIEVKLARPPASGTPLEIRKPAAGEELFLVGAYAYSKSPEWIDDILWAEGQSCRVKWTDQRCLYHGCQSTWGYSGAPLLARSGSGKMTVVGMHIGGVNERGGCSNALQATALMGNVGLILERQ